MKKIAYTIKLLKRFRNWLTRKPNKVYLIQANWGVIHGCFNSKSQAQHYIANSTNMNILECEVA